MAHRIAKHPDSILKQGIPKTYAFEIAHADELDELFYDELYDVAQSLDDESSDQWWILKPAMADRGQGIRLFNSKEALQSILDSFDDEDSDDESEESAEENRQEDEPSTKVSLNSMRDWVIQVRSQSDSLASSCAKNCYTCYVGVCLSSFTVRYERTAGSAAEWEGTKVSSESICASRRYS